MRKYIIMLIFCACIMRLGFLVLSKNYQSPQDWEYGDIARNIVAGNGFSRLGDPGGTREQTSSHAPLYIYFLALFYSMGTGSWIFISIELLQIALSLITLLVIYRLTLHVLDQIAAFSALFITAFYPPLVYYSVKLTPTTLFILLLLSSFWLITSMKRKTRLRAIIAGCTLALSFLCNAVALILIPLLILWCLFFRRDIFREVIITIAAASLLIVPYTIRNYKVHRTIVPITTQFGINFWIGNNPRATGSDYYSVASVEEGNFVLMAQTLSRAEKEKLSHMSEIGRMRFFLSEGLKFIRTQPKEALQLLAKKLYYYWWFTPLEINGSPDAHRFRTLTIIVYAPLLILAIVGIGITASMRKLKRSSLLLLFIIAYSSIFIITHVGLLRYRLPVETILAIFAGSALMPLFSRFIPFSHAVSGIDSPIKSE